MGIRVSQQDKGYSPKLRGLYTFFTSFPFNGISQPIDNNRLIVYLKNYLYFVDI